MSGFEGRMREYRQISLDRFDKANLKSSVFFLSHCHRDHMVGLDQQSFMRRLKSSEDVFLYCSEVTKLLLLSEDVFKPLTPYIRTLDLGVATTVTIPDSECKEYKSVVVTTLPAGHCPGSVMFLIEGKEGRVLYTGDFRWEKNYATTLPALCVNGHMKEIDSMYVDTTFCIPEAFHIPSRDDCLSATASLVVAWLRQSPHRYVHVSSRTKYGHEPLLSHLAKEAQTQVHTSRQKVEIYERISELRGVFTCDRSARIHACTWQGDCSGNSRLPCGYHPAKGDDSKIPEVMVIRPSTMWFTSEPSRLQELVVSPTSGHGIHRACYSFHSSYSELRDLISLLRPRCVYPNVLPASDTEWRQVRERVEKFLKYGHKHHMTPAGDTTAVKPLGLLKRKRKESVDDVADSEGLVFDSPEKKAKREDSHENNDARPSSQKSETSDILSPAKSDTHSSFQGSQSDKDMFADSDEDEDAGPVHSDDGHMTSLKESQSLRSYVSGDEECPEEDQVSSPQFRHITSKDDVDGDLPSLQLDDASGKGHLDRGIPSAHSGDGEGENGLHLTSAAETRSSESESSGKKSEASSLKESKPQKHGEALECEMFQDVGDPQLLPPDTTATECTNEGQENKTDVLSVASRRCSSSVENPADCTVVEKANEANAGKAVEKSDLSIEGDKGANESDDNSDNHRGQDVEKKRKQVVNGRGKNGKPSVQNSCSQNRDTLKESEKDGKLCMSEGEEAGVSADSDLDLKNTGKMSKASSSDSKPIMSQEKSATSVSSREQSPDKTSNSNNPTEGRVKHSSPATPDAHGRRDKQQEVTLMTLISSDSDDSDGDCRITESFIRNPQHSLEQVQPDAIGIKQAFSQGDCCPPHHCPYRSAQNRVSIDSGTIHRTIAKKSPSSKSEGKSSAATEGKTHQDSKLQQKMTGCKNRFATQRPESEDVSGYSDKYDDCDKQDKDNSVEIMEDASQDNNTADDADVEDNEDDDGVRQKKSKTLQNSTSTNSVSRKDRESQSSSPEVIVIEDASQSSASPRKPDWISQNNAGGKISAPWIPSSDQVWRGCPHDSSTNENKGFFQSHIYSPVKRAVVKASPEIGCCVHETLNSGQSCGHSPRPNECGLYPGTQACCCCSPGRQAHCCSSPAKESECSPSPAKQNSCSHSAKQSEGSSLGSEYCSSAAGCCGCSFARKKHIFPPKRTGSYCAKSSVTQLPKVKIYIAGRQATKSAPQKPSDISPRKSTKPATEDRNENVKVNSKESKQTADKEGSKGLTEGNNKPPEEEQENDSDETVPPDSPRSNLPRASCVSVVNSSSSDSDGDCRITESFIHNHAHHCCTAEHGGGHQSPDKDPQPSHSPRRRSNTACNRPQVVAHPFRRLWPGQDAGQRSKAQSGQPFISATSEGDGAMNSSSFIDLTEDDD